MAKRKRGSQKGGRRKKARGWAGPLIRSGFNAGGALVGGAAAGGFTGGLGAASGAVTGARIGDGLYRTGRRIIKPISRMFSTGRRSKGRGAGVIIKDAQGLQAKNLGLVMLGKGKKPVRTVGTYQYKNVNQWVMTVPQGLQVVDFPECLCTRNQLTGLVTSGTRSERYTWHDNPFTLNPYYARPASALYSAISTVSRNDQLYLKNAKTTFEILSMSKLPQTVVVYWLVSKFDTDVNPIDCWNTIISGKNEGQAAAVVANVTTTTTAGAGAASSTNVGANPFHHIEFKNQWKAVKTAKLLLQPGEQINLKLEFMYEKIWNRATLEDVRKTQFLAGITVFPMVIVKAGLEGIMPEGGSSATEVSYGSPKVGVVVNELFTFGALPAPKQSINRVYEGILINDTTEAERLITDDEVIADAGEEN